MYRSGIGALDEIAAAGELLRARGPGKLSPFFVPRVLANMGAGHVAIRHGLRGPSHSAATACATGALL
jgi:3-oxoacyl-[acyl-carrier-protein] synthase II